MNTAVILALLSSVSLEYNIPEGLLASICYKESTFNVQAINRFDGGKTHSYGICQVKLETAKFMGFKGNRKALQDPETNITYAAKYLRYQYRRYRSWVKAIGAYNRGSVNGNCTNYSHEVIDIWMTKRYLN